MGAVYRLSAEGLGYTSGKAMLARIRSLYKRMTHEDYAVALFGASFFVGVWYAFPMVNTITDVWAFGGGVLRAIEAHTLLPGYGVAYGTLSFYQNYAAMLVALAAGYAATGFDAEALKTLLILNPSLSLLVPRIVSALTSVVLLIVAYRFLKAQVEDAWWRFALLALTFGSVLITLLVRSGKMWMLSLLLIVVSFICLYLALTRERASGKLGWLSFVSVMTAFLAAANFLFAGLFLVNIPILLFAFWGTPGVWKRLAGTVAAGAAVFLAFFALNAANIVGQSSGFVMQFIDPGSAEQSVRASLTFLESFAVNARQAIESFPLLLLALAAALYGGIRDKTLFSLAALYGALYIVAVSVVFRADDGLALNIRHAAPLGFFLMFMLAACAPPRRFVSGAFAALGLAAYAHAVVLLSVPTTYNAAYDFIEETYAAEDLRIDERIFELTLPMNKASYALFAPGACGSTCLHMKALDADIGFRPVVVTAETDPAALATLRDADLLVLEREMPGCPAVAHFGQGLPDAFDIDINLGRMLLPSYYQLAQLGKDIYLYDARSCAGKP